MGTTTLPVLSAPGTSELVTVDEAARRTGLAETPSVFAALCQARDIELVCAGAGRYVELRSFTGAVSTVDLRPALELERGVL